MKYKSSFLIDFALESLINIDFKLCLYFVVQTSIGFCVWTEPSKFKKKKQVKIAQTFVARLNFCSKIYFVLTFAFFVV